MQTHIIRAKLMHDKRTYRDIEIPGDRSLYDLAEAIVASFDFDFDHAFGFYDNLRDWTQASVRYELFADMGEGGDFGAGPKARSVERTKLSKALAEPKQKMLFLFDYGDGWMFEIEVRGFGETAGRTRYPRMLAAKGAAPEQYPSLEEDWDDEDEER